MRWLTLETINGSIWCKEICKGSNCCGHNHFWFRETVYFNSSLSSPGALQLNSAVLFPCVLPAFALPQLPGNQAQGRSLKGAQTPFAVWWNITPLMIRQSTIHPDSYQGEASCPSWPPIPSSRTFPKEQPSRCPQWTALCESSSSSKFQPCLF